MSNEAPAPPEPEVWPPLSILDRRVLGVLIEKQKTSKSPDAYPMSINAITTGCNQKSNRDPVLDLDEDDVETTLTQLQGGGWVSKITGGRVERWRHLLYENWRVGKVELSILAELLLRGPQSEGDLRGRVGRMDDIADLDLLKTLLKPLADRGLVVYLTPPDRRGCVLTHGFHPPEELEAARATFGNAAGGPSPTSRGASVGADQLAAVQERLGQAFEDIARLRSEVAALREQLAELRLNR
ncbi:DUF480 domain-containing protein [Limnoglobus roseus]|uniref:DUF480 domain-containing protein n=1 Tax=Limnoglobus roseus TaxID=2598579 RepID=A0A5C1AKB7_9BACT|nr:DUF480 domain-containing protein [Limnoglobus roseus]QEL18132.1 hypothetical protein PX52LOC_05146 [Limnoglobus roseus]